MVLTCDYRYKLVHANYKDNLMTRFSIIKQNQF